MHFEDIVPNAEDQPIEQALLHTLDQPNLDQGNINAPLNMQHLTQVSLRDTLKHSEVHFDLV
jgi:hypothetical protein